MTTRAVGINKDVTFTLRREFVQHGVHLVRGEWQALKDDRPQMSTVELYDVSIDSSVPTSSGPDGIEDWQTICQPNLPWAEDHFQERVEGTPLNPGEQYKNWPWYKGGVEEHKQTGKFSHTYMERYWPKKAGYDYSFVNHPHFEGDPDPVRKGIWYEYGDLADFAWLLSERPMTRQAYLPIWFPEDLMASRIGERVPCSLGYLIQYNGESQAFDMWYFMRSVDFIRYMWDDIYMAGRLLQWVCAVSGIGDPGTLHTKIANLHIFQPEFKKLKEDYEKELNERMFGAF